MRLGFLKLPEDEASLKSGSLADRPAAGRPPPGTALACRSPARRIPRLALRSCRPGGGTELLGEGDDPAHGIPSAG
jgi:hypothetical protein